MKKNRFILVSVLSLAFLSNYCDTDHTNTIESETQVSEEIFLGQKPPGATPELFAPGIVSTEDLEIEAALSPNMDELYFVRQKKDEVPRSHLLQFENGEWKEQEMDRLSGEVFISSDNQIMHLGNNFKERTDDGWEEEKSLGSQFDTYPIMRLTSSSAKTYVFDEREEFGIIRYSRVKDGEREDPKIFGKNINTGRYTAHPFIAPDESYLIWDSEREGGYGASDLYICFRQEDGSWGAAINMVDNINSEVDDTYGSVSSDGKYFFFNRIYLAESFEDSEANIFWVDANFIKNLQH
jgi:hypothetical protein